MKITDIRIIKIYPHTTLKAEFSVTLDNEIKVHGIELKEKNNKFIVSMPSFLDKNNITRNIAHPITQEFRREFDRRIIEEYNKAIKIVSGN